MIQCGAKQLEQAKSLPSLRQHPWFQKPPNHCRGTWDAKKKKKWEGSAGLVTADQISGPGTDSSDMLDALHAMHALDTLAVLDALGPSQLRQLWPGE